MPKQKLKPIILLTFANEQDDRARYLRTLPEEGRRLRRTLEKAEAEGLCQLEVRTNATLSDMRDVFRKYDNRIAVFHFGGHADSYGLLFEDEGGKTAAVDATGFAGFLAQQASLQLVFLNACSTAGQVAALQAAGVAVVIATAQDILDAVATDFADEFYKSLATGTNSVNKAFAEAAALVNAGHGGDTRNLRPVAPDQTPSDQPPWRLYTPPGAEGNVAWSLQIAANDPLFSLPPLPKLDLPETPYRHLEWFRREDAEIFFGRGHEIAELYQQVTTPDGDPIILFYGQSGVGKSSVLAAGLLPRLAQQYLVAYQRRDQAKGLAGTLATALAAADAANLSVAWRAAEADAGKPLIVILDQVEELFTRPNVDLPDEMMRFLAVLESLFVDPGQRPQGRLILSFRKEWLAEIEARLKERVLPRTKLFLERLNQAGIVEAIAGPARVPRLRNRYALSIADELPSRIADDLVADPGSPIAPMLQILLTGLWAAAKAQNYDHPCFDQARYDDLRAKGLGLDDFLARQLAALHATQVQAVESGLALDLLAYHTTPLGTAEQRTLAKVEETYSHQAAALPGLMQECRNLYLLVDPSANQPDQPAASRLTHDTLAPHVRKRFEESDAPGQRARRILENRAIDWQEGQAGVPLDRQDLALVEAGAHGMRARLDIETHVVAVSREAREKGARIERLVRGFLIGAVLLIVAASAFAWWQSGVANQREKQAVAARDVSKARQLAADAIAQLPSNPELSVLLAAESAAVTYTTQTEEAIRESLLQSHVYATLTIRDPLSFGGLNAKVSTALFTPDSQYIMGVSDCSNELWQIQTRQLVAELNMADVKQDESGFGISCGSSFARFSPTGKFIVSSYRDGADGRATKVWETKSGRRVATLDPVGTVWGADFSPDEEFVVTAEGSSFSSSHNWGIARIWKLSTGEVIAQLDEPTDTSIKHAEFSPNGRWILTTTSHMARIWEWKTGKSLSTFNYYDFFPVFSSDSQQILAAVDDHTARLMNPASGKTTAEFDHGRTLSGVRFSPNNHYVVTEGESVVRVWQAATGSAVAQIRSFGNQIQVMDFSQDSKYLLTIEGKLAQVWEAETGKLISLLAGHVDQVNTAAFSPDGQFVVSAGRDHVARVWAASTGALLAELRGHTSSVIGAAFSRDGKWIVTTSEDRTVRLWDVTTIKPISELRGHTGGRFGLTDVTISPDSQFAVTINGADGRVWALATGRAGQDLHGAVRVEHATFSPDGRLVVLQGVSRQDRTSQVVEWKTGRNLAALGGILYNVEQGVLSSDGQRASIAGAAWPNGSGNVVYTWNLETGARLTSTLPILEQAIRLGSLFTLDGRFVLGSLGAQIEELKGAEYIFSADRSIMLAMTSVATLWDPQRWQKTGELRGYSGPARTAQFSPDTQLLVTAADHDKNVFVWSTSSGEKLATLNHSSEVNDASFSPDSHLIVTATDDNIARIWEALTGHLVAEMIAPTRTLSSAEFSTNGAYVVAASTDNTMRIWETATWKPLATVTGASPVFSPDGKSLITYDSSSSNALVWAMPAGTLLFTLDETPTWYSSGINQLEHRPQFSRDSKFLAIEGVAYANLRLAQMGYRVWNMDTQREFTKSDGPIIAVNMDKSQVLVLNAKGEVQLWDLSTDKLTKTLGGEALKPIFSPDSRLVATVGENTAQLWDATTGQPLRTLRGHTDTVNKVQFNFDSRSIVTASSDHTARLWDMMTGRTLLELKGHTAQVTNAMFSPDGQSIITVSDDGTARVWRMPTGEQVREIAYANPPDKQSTAGSLSDDLGAVPPPPRAVSVLSPNGQYLVTATASALTIWEVNTGRKVAAVENPTESIPAFSPDSRWLAFATKHTVSVFEARTGRLVAQLSGHTDNVFDVEFSNNGQYLATASADGTAHIFPLERLIPYEDLVELAHVRVSRRLTCDERKNYIDEKDACTTQLDAEARLEEGRELARNGDVEGATAKFEQARTLDETIAIEPKTEAVRIAVDTLSLEAERIGRRGDVQAATTKFNQALQLNPALGINPSDEARRYALEAQIEGLTARAEAGDNVTLDTDLQTAFFLAEPPPILSGKLWNSLCWLGALNGYAERVVKGACESAVSIAGLADFYDSRGLARALTGDRQGAIEDFELFLKWAKATRQSEDIISEREAFIAALKAGKNPFDEVTLAKLRNE